MSAVDAGLKHEATASRADADRSVVVSLPACFTWSLGVVVDSELLFGRDFGGIMNRLSVTIGAGLAIGALLFSGCGTAVTQDSQPTSPSGSAPSPSSSTAAPAVQEALPTDPMVAICEDVQALWIDVTQMGPTTIDGYPMTEEAWTVLAEGFSTIRDSIQGAEAAVSFGEIVLSAMFVGRAVGRADRAAQQVGLEGVSEDEMSEILDDKWNRDSYVRDVVAPCAAVKVSIMPDM